MYIARPGRGIGSKWFDTRRDGCWYDLRTLTVSQHSRPLPWEMTTGDCWTTTIIMRFYNNSDDVS